MKPIIFSFVLVLFCSAFAQAQTASPVGSVASSDGTVTLQRGGKYYKLSAGVKLYNGDTVQTAKASFAKLLFNDDSLLTIGASSAFKLENYAVTAQSRTASFRLMFGKVRAIVSKFASGSTDYKFITPTAVAGVRGTHLVLEFDQASKKTTLSVIEGSVGFRGADVSTDTIVGTQQRSTNSNGATSNPTKLSDEDNKKLNEEITQQNKNSRPATETASEKGGNKDASTGAGESTVGDAGKNDQPGTSDDAMQRVEQGGLTGPAQNTERQLPSENPASDTGVRVHW